MGSLSVSDISQGIRDTLEPAHNPLRAQSGTELSEAIPDTPLLQVYFESEDTDASGVADRFTFKAGVRVAHLTFYADVYVRQRGNIGEDIAACETMVEAVRAILAAQDTKPYFGLEGLKAYRWRSQRVTFEYGEVKYSGIRFTIEVWVF